MGMVIIHRRRASYKVAGGFMGTGLLAALNRKGAITPLISVIDQAKKGFTRRHLSVTRLGLFNATTGQFESPKDLPKEVKSILAQYFSYSEWARIALDVANQYPGGDYFEFGSEGLNTLCNFLAAFHLNGHDQNKPNVRCFAFDVFGDPGDDSNLTSTEQTYFNVHKRGQSFYGEMEEKLRDFGLMSGRVELIKGYFKDTLNDAFKTRLRAEKRRVGVAFLDCNIPSSYKTCFDFLVEFIQEHKAFVYMDEYFQIPGVATLFDEFCSAVLERYGLKARYIRTAGAFGALFVLIR